MIGKEHVMKKFVLNSLFALALMFSALVVAGDVNVNKASPQEIASNLKGIGLKKAQAIVAYRKKHGAFKKVDDLTMVKGIGQKTLARIKKQIKLGTRRKRR